MSIVIGTAKVDPTSVMNSSLRQQLSPPHERSRHVGTISVA